MAVLWWWAIPAGCSVIAYLWVLAVRRPAGYRRSRASMDRMTRFRAAMREGRRHG